MEYGLTIVPVGFVVGPNGWSAMVGGTLVGGIAESGTIEWTTEDWELSDILND